MTSRIYRILQAGLIAASSVLTASVILTPPEVSHAVATHNQSAGIDWVIVVDTSASMVGAGGTKNIFRQVQATVTDFVNSASVGDTVTIFTFDRDVTLRSNIRITSNIDRGNLKRIIQQLQATGQRTHIGQAIQEALNYSAELAQRPEADRRTTSLVLLTDGLEDVEGIPNPVRIPTNIALVKEQHCKPYIFFVSLGEREHESQLDEFVSNPALCQRGQVMRNPGAINLLQAGERIRQTVQASLPPQPPRPITLQVDPTSAGLNLGEVNPGDTTTRQSLIVRGSQSTKVQIQLDSAGDTGIELLEPHEAVAIAGQSPTPLPIRLRVLPNAIAGKQTVHLTLIPESSDPNALPVNTPVTVQLQVAKQVQIEPSTIDFGEIARGQVSPVQTIQVWGNGNFDLSLQLAENPDGFRLKSPQSVIHLKAGETSPIAISIASPPTSNPHLGQHSLELRLLAPDDPTQPLITATAQVELVPPLWQRLAWLSVPLLVMAGMVGAGIAWLNSPGQLEGVLQILYPTEPTTESEPWTIDLARQKKARCQFSDILAAKLGMTTAQELLKGNDASIEVIKQGKQRQIRVQRIIGSVSVNDQEIVLDSLFDGDVIQLGAIKLRFDCLDFPRPDSGEFN